MKDLTTTELQTLIGKIKSFLNITWTDDDTDNDIYDFIKSSIRFLDETAGAELDYLLETESKENTTVADNLYKTMCYLGQELLKNRVFYLREKALDDFSKNYQSEIVALFNYGKIYKEKVKENVKQ